MSKRSKQKSPGRPLVRPYLYTVVYPGTTPTRTAAYVFMPKTLSDGLIFHNALWSYYDRGFPKYHDTKAMDNIMAQFSDADEHEKIEWDEAEGEDSPDANDLAILKRFDKYGRWEDIGNEYDDSQEIGGGPFERCFILVVD